MKLNAARRLYSTATIPLLLLLPSTVRAGPEGRLPTIFGGGGGPSQRIASARDEVCWSEPVDLSDTRISSEIMDAFGIESEVANDFVINYNALVTKAIGYGGYYNWAPSDPPITSLNWRFYDDAGCVPGALLSTFMGLGTETFIGFDNYGFPTYRYELSVSQAVNGGEIYWLGLQAADHPFPPQWGRQGTGGIVMNCETVFKSAFFAYPNWTPAGDVVGRSFDAAQEFVCGSPVGACCFPDGSCQVMTRMDCEDGGFDYQGDGSLCDPNPCQPPLGACCEPISCSCMVLAWEECLGIGGEYQGDGSVCDSVQCPDNQPCTSQQIAKFDEALQKAKAKMEEAKAKLEEAADKKRAEQAAEPDAKKKAVFGEELRRITNTLDLVTDLLNHTNSLLSNINNLTQCQVRETLKAIQVTLECVRALSGTITGVAQGLIQDAVGILSGALKELVGLLQTAFTGLLDLLKTLGEIGGALRNLLGGSLSRLSSATDLNTDGYHVVAMDGAGWLELKYETLSQDAVRVPIRSLSMRVWSEPSDVPGVRLLTVVPTDFEATLDSVFVNGQNIGESELFLNESIPWTAVYDSASDAVSLPLGGVIVNGYTPVDAPMVFSLVADGNMTVGGIDVHGDSYEPAGGLVHPCPATGALTVAREQKISDTQGGFGGLLDQDAFGRSVAHLGDLDGDGVSDIAVGASGAIRGAVHILFLHADGTVKSSTRIDPSSLPGNCAPPSSDFGTGVASLGDIDGVGGSAHALAVGVPWDDDGGPDRGAVHILFLDAGGQVLSCQKISSQAGELQGPLHDHDWFGWSVRGLGDLDGDTIPDLAVGAVLDDDGGGGDRGAVWILFLNRDGTVRDEQKISATAGGFAGVLEPGTGFGNGLARLDDYDRDGTPELAVAAHTDDDDAGCGDCGAVWVLFLDADGTVHAHQRISATDGGLGEGTLDPGDYFGSGIGSAGDMNGDGIEDLLVGAYGDDGGGQESGAVWLLLMNADGSVRCTQKVGEGSGGFDGQLDPSDQFGTSIAGLADLDGDNLMDFAVGARFDDDGGDNRGAVWLLFSSDFVSSVATPQPPARRETLLAIPNPFSATTVFRTEGAEGGRIEIFDAAGRRMRTLVVSSANGARGGSVTWDGRDESDTALPAGIYFAKWTAPGRSRAVTVILTR